MKPISEFLHHIVEASIVVPKNFTINGVPDGKYNSLASLKLHHLIGYTESGIKLVRPTIAAARFVAG